MNERGLFITVEGIEGVGKSTALDYVRDRLTRAGIETHQTREPGGTPAAERIRALLLDPGGESIPAVAELLLFFASRALNIRHCIRPALESGTWVLCDRFTDATRAYQVAGRGQLREQVETLAGWVQEGLEPDLTLLLDAPVSVGLERAGRRGARDRMESEQAPFYERVRTAYLELARAHSERFRVIDASGDLQSVRVQLDAAMDPYLDNNSL